MLAPIHTWATLASACKQWENLELLRKYIPPPPSVDVASSKKTEQETTENQLVSRNRGPMYGHAVRPNESIKDSYIIWSPEATLPPRYVYPDRPSAIKVAYEMAAKNPGQRFAVCKVVGEAKANSVKYESFEE